MAGIKVIGKAVWHTDGHDHCSLYHQEKHAVSGVRIVLLGLLGSRGRVVKALDPRFIVLVSTVASPVMCKCLGQALNPHRLYPPSSDGYQVDRKLVLCEKCTAFSQER